MQTSLASYIDHTLLKPDATKEDIDALIDEALAHQFFSVCVHQHWVDYCYQRLKNSSVKVCTVVGFPFGTNFTSVKAFETTEAVKNGACEIDMVLNIGALKDHQDELVQKDIEAVVQAAGDGVLVKVIIETALLTNEEKIRACLLAKQAQADFVKTSTGFSGGGATIEDITLMRETVGPNIGVKASGGVRNRDQAKALIEAGATRIGSSSSVAIISSS